MADVDELTDQLPAETRQMPHWTTLALIVLVAGLLMGGAGMLVGGEGHDHTDDDVVGLGETIEIDGALIRVEEIRPEVMAAMRMPTSMMPDMVPDGYRRFTVDMTVMATSAGGFDPEPSMFTVWGDGLDPVAPHRAVADPNRISDGSRGFVSMMFQTPLEVEPVFLNIDGADVQVQLEGDLGDGHNHGGVIGNDIVLAGYFEAEIDNYTFLPDDLIVETGTEIVFHNHDRVLHNATGLDGSWGTADVSQDERTEVVVFDEPGTYRFYCTIHPTMTATINVVNSG